MTQANQSPQTRLQALNLGKEFQAAVVGFLSSVYILFLMPSLLGDTGMPIGGLSTAIAVVAGVSCLIMGVLANRPFVLAPGVGIGAYFVYGVVLGKGLSWQAALAAAFCAGVLMFVLSLLGLRNFMLEAIPQTIKTAFMAGLGLFIALLGLRNGGLIVADPVTLVKLGDLSQGGTILALFGVLLIAFLVALRVPMAFSIGLVVLTFISWVVQLNIPTTFISNPAPFSDVLLKLDFSSALSSPFLIAVIGFFFIGLLDPAATFAGLGRLAGLQDSDGKVFGSNRSYIAGGLSMLLGPLLGVSPVVTFVESAVPMQEGGRTGWTAIFVGLLFLLALFFLPVLGAIPAVATAPLLVVVGAIMMRGVADLEWSRMEDILPAFFVVATMAFTFNIATGIALGMIAYVVLYAILGRSNEVHPFSYVLTLALVGYLAFYG